VNLLFHGVLKLCLHYFALLLVVVFKQLGIYEYLKNFGSFEQLFDITLMLMVRLL